MAPYLTKAYELCLKEKASKYISEIRKLDYHYSFHPTIESKDSLTSLQLWWLCKELIKHDLECAKKLSENLPNFLKLQTYETISNFDPTYAQKVLKILPSYLANNPCVMATMQAKYNISEVKKTLNFCEHGKQVEIILHLSRLVLKVNLYSWENCIQSVFSQTDN